MQKHSQDREYSSMKQSITLSEKSPNISPVHLQSMREMEEKQGSQRAPSNEDWRSRQETNSVKDYDGHGKHDKVNHSVHSEESNHHRRERGETGLGHSKFTRRPIGSNFRDKPLSPEDNITRRYEGVRRDRDGDRKRGFEGRRDWDNQEDFGPGRSAMKSNFTDEPERDNNRAH